jgi:hypothetical protein
MRTHLTYKRLYIDGDKYQCVYCGELADTMEHCPPVSLVGPDIEERYKDRLILVPACHECNSALGDRYLLTLENRADFLVSFYKKKYKKFDRVVAWDLEELEELDGGLQQYVRGCQNEYLRLRERLQNLRSRSQVGAADLIPPEAA